VSLRSDRGGCAAGGEARVGRVGTIKVRNDCDVKRVQRGACVCVGKEDNTTTTVVAKEEYSCK
jgi:hypothetical protein